MSSKRKIEAKINITGRVQGVGFRPYIYRKAVQHRLLGFVINLGDAGVEIEVEGTEEQIKSFIETVRAEAPPVSDIEDIHYEYRPYRGRFTEFIIDKSQNRGKIASGIFPPDIGICPQCLQDMRTEGSRWYDYPFTACAWCGPRFTSVKALPYDRERTHMHEFPLCKDCKFEYSDPMDRRFDAQGITCKICGPKMRLHDSDKNKIITDNIFKKTAKLLLEGNIIAIKGIGGIHLTSIATDDDIIKKFRHRKNRPYQPFALMSPDLVNLKKYAIINEEEKQLIQSWRKPIVLVKEKKGILSNLIAPGLSRVGVMLPYSGIQTMLFKYLDEPALVMTSGNKPGVPMAISNKAAFTELNGLADYFLLHNREIVNRSDDSVVRLIGKNTAFTRRSRGYVPEPIETPLKKGVAIAFGAELRNSGTILTNGKAFMTQYLGDVTSLEGIESEREAIKKLRDMLNITRNPDVMACDLHPEYMTSQLAEVISQETGVTLIKSQHHHAHITSVMVENNISLEEEILGIALDGAGYGINGDIWGGEVLKSSYYEFERIGHLEENYMPGGDLCANYPVRMLISSLYNTISDDVIRDITENHVKKGLPHLKNELNIILEQIQSHRLLKTSSAGRYLDSVSAIINPEYKRTYEGEPAMRLEAIAESGDSKNLNLNIEIIKNNGIYVLNTSNTLYYLLNNLDKVKKQDIAAFGQEYLVKGLSEIATKCSEDTGIKKIALSGGVFVNEYIASYLKQDLEKNGFRVIMNRYVPPGDGGIALGQASKALVSVI